MTLVEGLIAITFVAGALLALLVMLLTGYNSVAAGLGLARNASAHGPGRTR